MILNILLHHHIMENLLTPQNIKIMSSTLSNSKKKERYETILEPMQAILQLALLSFCPTGTKISITKNLLYLQQPTISQGIVRWYNNDNKDDLFYLFYACKRFPQFYASLGKMNIEEQNFLQLIINLAKGGLHKLAETYAESDKVSLLHTIEIYKALLDNPDKIPLADDKEKKDIEDVFIKITDLYNKQQLRIIFCTLLLMTNDEDNYMCYMDGLNLILRPTTSKISKWINDNVVF